MKKFYLPILLTISVSSFAQVGINTTTPSSTLDVVAKNATGTTTDAEGLLIPRVDRQKAQSMTGVATSTLIYVNSIATGTLSGTAANINAIGFYYFDGTVWVKLNSGTASSNDWTITGNAGTTAGTNFIGTTDNQDLIFKRNNVQSGWLNSAANNTAFGVSTLPTTASGTSNAAFGTSALAAVTTGAANVAVGNLAGRSITTGGNNIAIGKNALQGSTGGFRNVAVGENTLFFATGNENIAIGINTATAVTTGISNTAIGTSSLTGTTTGTGNIAVGYNALNTNTTGNNNIAIGYGANVNTNNLTNATAIGYNARVNQSNSVVLGATGVDAVYVGIGTTSPSGKMDIVADNIGAGAQNDVYFNGYGTSVAPAFYVGSARGTAAAPANLQNGDIIGGYYFNPRYNGVYGYTQGSGIYSVYKGTGTNAITDMIFRTSDTDRVKMDENGNIGIGTMTPATQLHTTGTVRFAGIGTNTVDTKILTADASGNVTTRTTTALLPQVVAGGDGADAVTTSVTISSSSTTPGSAVLLTRTFTLTQRSVVTFSYNLSVSSISRADEAALADGRPKHIGSRLIWSAVPAGSPFTVGNNIQQNSFPFTAGATGGAFGYYFNGSSRTIILNPGTYSVDLVAYVYAQDAVGVSATYGGNSADQFDIVASPVQ